MENIGHRMDGISLHYYRIADWNNKDSVTKFDKEDYYWTIGKCLEIEKVLKRHIQIKDKYNLQKRIALMVNEWGTWWDKEPSIINDHNTFEQPETVKPVYFKGAK